MIQPKAFPCPILCALAPVAAGQEKFKDFVPVSWRPQTPKAGPEGAVPSPLPWGCVASLPFPGHLPGCHRTGTGRIAAAPGSCKERSLLTLCSSVQLSISAGDQAAPEQTGHQINNALRRSTLQTRAVALVLSPGGSRGSDICSCFALLATEPCFSPTCPRTAEQVTWLQKAQCKCSGFTLLED